jgi:hypothetical protein
MVKSRIFLSAAIILFGMSLFSHAALDLKFTTAIGISPAAPGAGETVTFAVTFKSEGAASANMKIVGGIDGAQKFERVYASIPANGTRTDSFTWSATAGSHKAYFTLDPAHTAGDSNYGNNNIEKQFTVSGDQNVGPYYKQYFKQTYKLKPDLKVHDVVWQPLEEPKCGKKWKMGVILINDGKVAVDKPFTVAVSIQGILVDDHKMNGLNPGQEAGFYYDWYIFNDAYVRIVADFHNDIDESREDNNAIWPPIKCEK